MSKGYESLMVKVKRDCNKGQDCFNPEGCDHEFYRQTTEGCLHVSKCMHKYCDQFKWIIDRAKHYADKTGLSWEDILDKWEEECNYWYMNYYQDCNQPEIKGDNVRIFDTVQDFIKSIGDKKFRCPNCGGITSSPYECNGGCDWKVYGLFGHMGKGVYVYCKDKMRGENMFMPIAWEKEKD